MAGLDDDDVSEGSAERDVAGRHADGLKKLLSKTKPEPLEEDDVVAEDPPEPDDDEPETETRQDKRSRRGSERQTARERAAAAEARAQVLQEQLEAARSQRGPEPQRPTGNPVAEIDARYKQTNERLAALHDEWNRGKLSEDRQKYIRDEAERLELEKLSIVVERREALTAPMRQREAAVAQLRARAPDVYANPTALQYAEGEFRKRIARGEPDSLDTFEASMQEAREVILKIRPRPDAAQKGRAMGMGAGARASAGAESPVRISMPAGSALDKMARAAYPKDDPAVARQKWVNANGKAYLASKRG